MQTVSYEWPKGLRKPHRVVLGCHPLPDSINRSMNNYNLAYHRARVSVLHMLLALTSGSFLSCSRPSLSVSEA
jgi:hypothetical protein